MLHHRCVWRFTVVFSGSVVLHQRLLFHFIDEDAAIGSGAFLRLPPSEIWVASHSSYKVRAFYPSLFLLGCTHQTWTVTYTWNHSLTASVPHIYSVKISFCLLRVAALTYKTCSSLKKVGHVIRKIRCNSSIKLQFCTCLWLFCVKSCKTMTKADPLSWSLLHRHTVLHSNTTVTKSSTGESERSFELNTSKLHPISQLGIVWFPRLRPSFSCDYLTCNVMSSQGKLSTCLHPGERNKNSSNISTRL